MNDPQIRNRGLKGIESDSELTATEAGMVSVPEALAGTVPVINAVEGNTERTTTEAGMVSVPEALAGTVPMIKFVPIRLVI
jgi:hypothetical protein